MAETLAATCNMHAIRVDGHELTAKEYKDKGFLSVYIHSNHRIYSQSFWENMIIEIQGRLGIKITGTLGPLMIAEGKDIAELIFVFYRPGIETTVKLKGCSGGATRQV